MLREWFACLLLTALLGPSALGQERVRSELPYRDGTVVIVSDFQGLSRARDA